VQSRTAYRRALQAYFSDHQDQLDSDSLRRLTSNPLRILDSKVAATREIVKGAPEILTFLDSNARSHFDGLGESLHRSGIEFEVNQRLVRGLDYYTSTVFEWISDKLGAQSAVCAGGRYDGLVEKHSGRSTPAVGFALGIERLVELIQQENKPAAWNLTDVYIASATTGAHEEAVKISEMLRDAGFTVITHCGESKLKNQMKRANMSGARFAVITGLEESATGSVQVKPLRSNSDNSNNDSSNRDSSTSTQQQVRVDALVDWCRTNN
jgi:histidyl-tRNA synthetase